MNRSQEPVRTIQALSRCRDLDEVIAVLRRSVRSLIGADGITVVLRDGDFCYYVEEDAVGPLWKGRRFPMESCISGWCMIHRQQVAIRDIYSDIRIPHDAYRPTFVQSLIMTPIRSEDPIGAIGAYWADRHEATEDELALLQTVGDSASVAVANAELIASLEDANRRKDEFMAMLAHELRNPLAPIRNAAYMLRLQATDAPQADRAYQAVERQMQHMTRLIDDLVDVARLTRGQVDLERHRLDIASLVRQATDDWWATLDAAGITLNVEVPLLPVPVNADATRITQIIGNILDNARKFTPAGGRIDVTVRVEPEAGVASIVIRDSGEGIEAEQLPHIFEPLAQADRSLDRKPGGLGLGLSIARSMAELHGGTLSGTSEGKGSGARFTLRLPLDAQVDSPAVPIVALPTDAPRAKPRVLIVEDHEDSADTMRIFLEYQGFEVTVAFNGLDGVARAKAEHPQIILCDIGLPGLDGYGVAENLRADPATSGARLIAVTGYGSSEARERALQAGFDLHLVKPVDLRNLVNYFDLPIAS